MYRMKFFKELKRFLMLLFFAFMLAVCVIIGVAPVIPKRKEPFSIEVKIEQTQNDDEKTISLAQF